MESPLHPRRSTASLGRGPALFAFMTIAAGISMAGCSTVARTVGNTYDTGLTGAAEVPGPGDADGSGTARITADATTNQICYELTVQAIDAPTAAHIHRGAVGVAGPPVLTLDPPTTGASRGCYDVARELAAGIVANPENHYVNVHNARYPQGAVRGQLRR